MPSRLTITAFASVFAITLSVASAAKSFEGCNGDGGVYNLGGLGYGWAYGVGIGGLYNGLDRPSDYRVPYFAAHPPVYYSHPVPRTYGHSPFAYPPHFRTPEFCESVVPLTVTNPYVPAVEAPVAEEKEADETVAAPKTSDPLVIVNPFAVDTSLARTGR